MNTISDSNTTTVGSYSDFQSLIDNDTTGTVNLNQSYNYNNATDNGLSNGVTVNKSLIINGNGHNISGSNQARVLNITGTNVVLNNLTILNGLADNGAGIIIGNQTTLTIENSKITNNTADYGATILNYGNLNITNTVITNNTAKKDYSGIMNVNGTVNADYNWWGTNTPNNKSSLNNFNLNNWLIMTVSLSSNNISKGENVTVKTAINKSTDGTTTKEYNNTICPSIVTYSADFNQYHNEAYLTSNNGTYNYNETIITPNSVGNFTLIATIDNETILNNITVNGKYNTNLTANYLVKYYDVSGNFTGKLTDEIGNPLIGQHIALNLTKNSNNLSKIYWVTTDTNGEFQLEINLAPGIYSGFATYSGTNIYDSSISKIADIIVTTNATGLNKSTLTANNYSEKVNSSGNFTGKLLDANGNPIIGQHIALNLTRLSSGASKIYWVTTDENGEYQLEINLAVGEYTAYASYAGNTVYAPYSAVATITVFKYYEGNGIFVRYNEMNKLNFTAIKNANITTIFLSYGAVLHSNKTYIESWIKTANNYGLSVSIWYQVLFNSTTWYSPVTSTGEINQTLLNQKIAEVTSYAKITGVNGIFLDYIRYGGNAYQFKNASQSINYFVQQLSSAIKSVNKNLIVSGAIMSDTQGVYYYGQNVSSLNKYLDIIIPMIYSQNTSYLEKMTKYYVSLANKTTVWVALRTYVSETNITLLPYSTVLNETNNVLSVGANGVAYFRYGLMKFS